jgi:hypothetical protein
MNINAYSQAPASHRLRMELLQQVKIQSWFFILCGCQKPDCDHCAGAFEENERVRQSTFEMLEDQWALKKENEFDSMLQWLPREILEDVHGLVTTPNEAEVWTIKYRCVKKPRLE